MQSTIRRYTQDAMSNHGMGSYVSQAGPVLDSLAEREELAGEVLIQRAASLGLDRTQAEEVLIESGLWSANPEPEAPEVEQAIAVGEDQAPAWFTRTMQPVLDDLGRLKDLAKRHLGADV